MALRVFKIAVLLGVLALAGCQQDLYSSLTEYEANQMMAQLMANGISVEKVSKEKNGFTLFVDSRDMLRAVGVLNDAGYPKNTRSTFKDYFPNGGLTTSSFEERVRYIRLLEDKVAQTLSNIDGVITARVHIMLPDPPQLGQSAKPSSAAVFIKHQPGVDLDYFVPQIRRLVSNSIEGLEYTAVAVVLTDATPAKMTTATPSEVSAMVEVLPGLSIKESSRDRFWQVVVIVGVITALLIASNIAMLVTAARGWRRRRPSIEEPLAIVEPS